jgi:Uma2 family endonuclease
MVELTNTTFRKAGLQDAQPDIAFYIGQSFTLPPRDNCPIDVIEHGAPQLVIEVASTTLNDDLGRKRLLYERLGCQEYWVVDVETAQVIAFAIADRRSGQIANSEVLPRASDRHCRRSPEAIAHRRRCHHQPLAAGAV